jgi:hypothetical protein
MKQYIIDISSLTLSMANKRHSMILATLEFKCSTIPWDEIDSKHVTDDHQRYSSLISTIGYRLTNEKQCILHSTSSRRNLSVVRPCWVCLVDRMILRWLWRFVFYSNIERTHVRSSQVQYVCDLIDVNVRQRRTCSHATIVFHHSSLVVFCFRCVSIMLIFVCSTCPNEFDRRWNTSSKERTSADSRRHLSFVDIARQQSLWQQTVGCRGLYDSWTSVTDDVGFLKTNYFDWYIMSDLVGTWQVSLPSGIHTVEFEQ